MSKSLSHAISLQSTSQNYCNKNNTCLSPLNCFRLTKSIIQSNPSFNIRLCYNFTAAHYSPWKFLSSKTRDYSHRLFGGNQVNNTISLFATSNQQYATITRFVNTQISKGDQSIHLLRTSIHIDAAFF